MTIGIDIRVLTRGARTGVEEYTINLLFRLLKLAPEIKFKLFFNAFKKTELDYDWISLPNVELRESRIPNRLLFILAKYFNYPKLDKLLGGADVFFNPHFFNAPVKEPCQKAMTFHDLSFEYLPELFSWRKRAWQNLLMNAKKEAQCADKIIAVSESTKHDLVDLYKINPEKIKVIYSGVGEEFRLLNGVIASEPSVAGRAWQSRPIASAPGVASAHAASLNDWIVRKKYNLPDRFILYFGTLEPRKNIVGLIRAFELLKEKNKDFDDFYLVVAGGRGWLDKNIFKKAKQSKFADQIIFTGFVAPEDKVYFYNLAKLFVYPSFFEGFGFPPLEAMACGVPVVTSNTSSLPEVVGDAALMVDPYDIEELSWAMEQVVSDNELNRELARRGLERAKMFSWDKCARETLDFLIS
jgi:glycosyltransferase involved in cell wall biosynthesis